MKLKYKISLIMTLAGIFLLTTVSYLYSNYSYNNVISSEKTKLSEKAIDSAYLIELELGKKLSIVKTIGTSPLLQNTLTKSNSKYEALNKTQQKDKIEQLNNRWIQAKNAEDPFIKPYLNNPLALYLKSQQKILPGVYGEIFITNTYGVMIATTGKLSTLAHSHKYWWKEAFNNGKGKTFFDDRGFDKSVKGYVIGVTIPIKKDNKIIGILKANVNIAESLSNVIKHYSELNHGDLKIVRTKGLVVLESHKPPLSTKVDKKLLRPLESMKVDSILLDNDIVAYAPVLLTSNSNGICFGSKHSKEDHIKGNQDEAWHIVIRYSKDEAMASCKELNRIIIYVGVIVTLLLLFISLLIGMWISSPINKLSKIAYRIGEGEHNLKADENGNDEISMLSKSFNTMLTELNNSTISIDKLKKEVERRKEVERNLKAQENILISQSRQAAMGEIISMIAHQWRQPLSVIAMGANNIMADIELDMIDNTTLQNNAKEILNYTKELSKTIDDFKNFFKQTEETEIVSPKDIINEAFDIIGKTLEDSNIDIITHFHSDKKIKIYSSELKQVIVNIINNAKEALICKDIKNKKIEVSIKDNNNNIYIDICDNAGGVPSDIMDKIFNPYFSTKYEKSGTGLGLYMSKTIIEKHLNGIIEVENSKYGACFKIKLPCEVR